MKRPVSVRFLVGNKARQDAPGWAAGRVPADLIASGIARLDLNDDERYPYDSLKPAGSATEPTDDMYVARTVANNGEVLHLRFGRVRRDQLPDIERLSDGTSTPLKLLEDEGVAEYTDFLFFKKTGVVGQLVNGHGPGKSSLEKYLKRKVDVAVELVTLLDESAVERMNSARSVRLGRIALAPGHLDVLDAASAGVGDALLRMTPAETDHIEIVFRQVSRDSERRDRFHDGIMDVVGKLAGRRSDLEDLMVIDRSGETVRDRVIRAVEDVIGFHATVEVESGRRIDEGTARETVVRGYETEQARIADATSRMLKGEENRMGPDDHRERRRQRRAEKKKEEETEASG